MSFFATHGGRKMSMSRNRQSAPCPVDTHAEAEEIERREQSLDAALKDTFPASDPPAALAPHRQDK